MIIKKFTGISSINILRYSSVVCNNLYSGLPKENETYNSYKSIPTVPYWEWPLLGHIPAMNKYGIQRSTKMLKECKEKFTSNEIGLLRVSLPALNSKGDGRVVMLFDPYDIELVYRYEGKYPYRGEGLSLFGLMRSRRPDVFGETTGITLEEGNKWHNIRKKVQQDLMKPKSAMFYLNEMQTVSQEFVDYIERHLDSKRVNRKDFLSIVQMYAFESISLVAIDTKMGCLHENPDPFIMNKIESGKKLIETFSTLAFAVPTWNFLPPRLNPLYRKAEDYFNDYVDFVRDKVKEAIDRIQHKVDNKNSTHLDSQISILEKFIINNGPDSPIPFVMAFDMVIGGIDTTGNSAAFLLYHLSRNLEKQEKLREEIQSFGDKKNLSESELGKMKYFRACMKESFRLTPTVASITRVLSSDIILKGFRVPKNTLLCWNGETIGHDEYHFKDPKKYRPERWLEDKDSIHSFSVLPFSHGPRMCIGKRFAELEIQLLIVHLLKNYRIEWAGVKRPIETYMTFTNVPDSVLKFKFIKI